MRELQEQYRRIVPGDPFLPKDWRRNEAKKLTKKVLEEWFGEIG